MRKIIHNKIIKENEYNLIDVNVIDVINETILFNVNVYIKNGVIISVGKNKNPGVEDIECRGEYLLPGLINLHCHMFGTGKPSNTLNAKGDSQKKIVKLLQTKFGHWLINTFVKHNAITALRAGTTTIRTMGDFLFSDVEQRDAINLGKYLGPRMLVCGPAITSVGGHADGTISLHATTKKEYEDLVKNNISHHVDLIKIMITGGVMDCKEKGEPGELRMNLENVAWVSDIAHKNGLKVAAHVESTEGVIVALKGGVDTIEHAAILTDEEVELFHKLNKTITTTISPAVPYSEFPMETSHCTEDQVFNAKIVAKGIIEGSKRAIKEGIVVGLGTDTACPYAFHYNMWRELAYFVRYVGVTPAYAIKTATIINAKIIGLDKEIGSIENNKLADLMLVRDDPFKNINTLANPTMVIKNGIIISKPHNKKYKKFDDLLDTLS